MKLPLCISSLAILAILAQATACSGDPKSDETSGRQPAGVPTVYTVNYPLKYFVERIAGERLQVELPAPADIDPAFWMPDPATISGYQSADLILLNGATYAKWIDKVSLPESKLVFTSDAFADELIAVEGEVTHTHGPGGEHSHQGTAFTTWLDPTLAIRQAEAVRQAVTAEWPEHGRAFQVGFDSLENDLLALDRLMRQTVGDRGNTALVASHPVYQYLTRRYGLNVRSVQWEPGEAPSSAMWRDLRAILRDQPARWMLWEDTPLPETADQLRGLGVESAVFNQCGNQPAEGDYMDVMRENIKGLESVFGGR